MVLLAWIALGLAQDPPAPKTAEDRVRELEQKLAQLEKRQRAAAQENETLEKRLAELIRVREAYIKQASTAWIKQYGTPAALTPEQAASLESLWAGWTRADLETPVLPQTWLARETELKKSLTAEQVATISLAVSHDQRELGKTLLGFMLQQAKLSAESQKEAEHVVLSRLPQTQGLLLPQAHPDQQMHWARLSEILEASLADLGKTLTPEEQSRLRKSLLPQPRAPGKP